MTETDDCYHCGTPLKEGEVAWCNKCDKEIREA